MVNPIPKLMRLPTEKRKVHKTPSQAVWLLYGPPKIGKTTLLSKMPKPLVICTEKRQDFVEIYPMEVSTWEELLSATSSIKSEDHDFQTIGIDTVGDAWDFCIAYVCKKYNCSHLFDLGKGKGWDIAKFNFRQWLSDITDYVRKREIGLVFIAHEKLEVATYKGEEDAQVVPFMQGSLKTALNPKVDITARMSFGRFMYEGKMRTGHILTAQPNTRCEAGDSTNTIGRVPEIILEPESEIWSNVEKVFKELSDE